MTTETLSDNGLTLKEIDNLLSKDSAKDVFYHESKIKIFIAKLKEFVEELYIRDITEEGREEMQNEIDKLAGKNLI